MNLNVPIIEAKELTKHFGGTRNLFTRTPTVYAVNGVSFSVQKGETFAIVGESGCGKSTLGRLLLRLIDSTEGRVIYEGKDITYLGTEPMRRLRREMQIIFQDPFASLNPGMTVGQIIGEPIALRRGQRSNGVSISSKHGVGKILDALNLAARHARMSAFLDPCRIRGKLFCNDREFAINGDVQLKHSLAFQFLLERHQHLSRSGIGRADERAHLQRKAPAFRTFHSRECVDGKPSTSAAKCNER